MNRLAVALTLWVAAGFTSAAYADEVEKVLFLVVEKTGVFASNTLTGRIDRLDLQAKERIEDYKVANAVAVVITNQRYAAYGVLPGGWQTVRVRAKEKTESVEVGDYSATVVTSDRVLNFYGRRGAWSETRRSVE
jgi:RecB family exonuclease